MGREITCSAHYNGDTARGKAHLESDHTRFSSKTIKVTVRHSEIVKLEFDDSALRLKDKKGLLQLDIGDEAKVWAEKIKNPPSLAKRLGLKKTHCVAFLGDLGEEVTGEVEGAVQKVRKKLAAGTDVILWRIDALKEMKAVPKMLSSLSDGGALWITFPRGDAEVKAATVIEQMRKHGIGPGRVARVSETLSGLRFSPPKGK